MKPWRRHELLELIQRRETTLGKAYSDELAKLAALIKRDPTDPVGVFRLTMAGEQELARQRATLAIADQVEAVYRGTAA